MISIEYKLPINCCAQLRLDGISQSQWSAVARLYCCCVSWFSKSRPLGFWLNFPCWCCWVQFYVDYLLIKFLAFFSWAFSELLQILEDRSTTQWFHNHALCLWHNCLFLLQKFPKLLLLSFFDAVEFSLSGLDLDLDLKVLCNNCKLLGRAPVFESERELATFSPLSNDASLKIWWPGHVSHDQKYLWSCILQNKCI